MLGIATGGIIGVFFTWVIVTASAKTGDPALDWCELDIIYALGFVKLVVTLVKYTPQVVANYRNKSTRGWSIWQILLDFAGGILSVSQQGIDSWLQGDWSGITGNPVKFALGNVSMIYDVMFMAQHYVIYGDEEGREREQLLPRDEERRID